MTATKSKILIFRDQSEIDWKIREINQQIKLIENLLEHYTALGVDVTEDEINALIKGNFSESRISELATKRAEKVPARQQQQVAQDFVEDANNYRDIFNVFGWYFCPDITVKNGKVSVSKATLQAIEDRYSRYLGSEKSIELYNRHNDLVNQLNDLKNDINAHSGGHISTAYLVHFDAEGNGYAPIVNINYGS
ncbi:hypothetical protein [Epilithonimonas hominis]|uniref:hypothetical protein n=1 Tax=Epilithonimonas hominis TaxID=420404 RepID=UPI00289FFC99|nr:hypothetical protein [Epilithonimonas hominis]